MSVATAGAPSADFVEEEDAVDAVDASDADVNEDDDANDADNEEDEKSSSDRPTLLPAAPVRELARLLLRERSTLHRQHRLSRAATRMLHAGAEAHLNVIFGISHAVMRDSDRHTLRAQTFQLATRLAQLQTRST